MFHLNIRAKKNGDSALSTAAQLKLNKRDIALSAGLFLLLLLIALVDVKDQLELSISAIKAGELWRLFSAHFVHANWQHLLINIASLIAFFCLFPEQLKYKRLSLGIVVNALLLSLGLLFVLPANTAYLGFSGLLYALLASAAMLNLRRNTFAPWVLLFLLLKITWEQIFGATSSKALLQNGTSAIHAHLLGALSGLASALVYLAKQKFISGVKDR
ncbi:rhombosortase [Agaribacterium haliotis]|uniref:rhombosortase n=1 Tax=Agaribacterium haliotis TaxID=2013869 RepID=UPI000BB57FD5|nr:rhombosortase [Agaribacterium haliotis]